MPRPSNHKVARKRTRNVWVQIGEYTSLAMLLPACTVIGYLMGHYLDRVFGTSFLTIIFLLFGIAAGFVQVVRQFQKDTDNSDN